MVNYVDIAQASSTAVRQCLLDVKHSGVLGRGLFLDPTNDFRVAPQPSSIDQVKAKAYLAISTITHLHDGWCYLGLALRSLFHNEVGGCGHAAYYAELRAALSFLAVNGILILNNKGFYLNSSLAFEPLYQSEGTHKAAWNSLNKVASLSSACDVVRFETLIQPDGILLKDWIDAFSKGISISAASCSCFLSYCGMDIGKYENDREARNKYSYSPCDIEPYRERDQGEICDLIKMIWRLFEPDAVGRFPKIDKFVLWFLLRGLKKNLNMSCHMYKGRIARMCADLALSDIKKGQLLSEIYGKRHRLHPMFDPINQYASGKGAEDLHVGVVLRACFLLRLATAACRNLLQTTGIGEPELRFWLRRMQRCRFMWQAAVDGYDYCDLWNDISLSQESLDTYAPVDSDPWNVTEAGALEVVSRTEYAMLWGLGL